MPSVSPHPESADPKRRARVARQRGLSLIELLTVISIAVILVGILVITGPFITESAEEQQTMSRLEIAVSALETYKLESDNVAPNHLGSSPIDWSQPKPRNASGATGEGTVDDAIERFVWAALQRPDVATMVRALGDGLEDTDGDGFLEIVDAFGTPLAYADRVTHDDPNTPADDFLPQRPQPFFVSAGRDRQFGATPDAPAAEDNLLSFKRGG